jgi:hypothetical protein
MEEELVSTVSDAARSPASSDLARWQTRLTGPVNWLRPAWAALCGAVASGSFGWQGKDWIRLALLILLADVGWGVLWAALGSTDWTVPLRRWRDWHSSESVARPPYTLPGSPGDRASNWLGQLRAWWRDVFWPACGLSLSAVVVALVVTAVLGTLLGADVLLLSAAALAVMQLGLAWEGGRGTIAPTWDAIVSVAFPWLAGHIVSSGVLTLPSAGLALAFTLAWGAAWQADSRWERLLGIGAQFLAAALLIVLRSTLAAAGLLVLLVPQLMLHPWLRRGQPASWYVRCVRPWMMAAMVVAAWAL